MALNWQALQTKLPHKTLQNSQAEVGEIVVITTTIDRIIVPTRKRVAITLAKRRRLRRRLLGKIPSTSRQTKGPIRTASDHVGIRAKVVMPEDEGRIVRTQRLAAPEIRQMDSNETTSGEEVAVVVETATKTASATMKVTRTTKVITRIRRSRCTAK